MCNFCFKILCELQLHIGKVTGEEVPRFEDLKDNWQNLLPYLCEEEAPKGRYFLDQRVTDTLSLKLLTSVRFCYLCLDKMSGLAIKGVCSFFSDCPPIVLFTDQVGADFNCVIMTIILRACVGYEGVVLSWL